MAEVRTIDVGRDFSPTPGGRYRADGLFSGEAFREEHLEPVIEQGLDIIVDLDSALGFTSSFLEETFGGLVRKYGPGIMNRVQPRALKKPHRVASAREYMVRAMDEEPRRAIK